MDLQQAQTPEIVLYQQIDASKKMFAESQQLLSGIDNMSNIHAINTFLKSYEERITELEKFNHDEQKQKYFGKQLAVGILTVFKQKNVKLWQRNTELSNEIRTLKQLIEPLEQRIAELEKLSHSFVTPLSTEKQKDIPPQTTAADRKS